MRALAEGRGLWVKPQTSLPDAVQESRVFAALDDLYRAAHQTASASANAARKLELWQHWNTQLPNNKFVERQLAAANSH